MSLELSKKGDKYKTLKGGYAKLGSKTQAKAILNREIHSAGSKRIFDIDKKIFIPISKKSELIKQGYQIKNNIASKLPYEVSDSISSYERTLNRAVYNLQKNKEQPKTFREFYNNIIKARILLYTNDERSEHKWPARVNRDDYSNHFVILRFMKRGREPQFRSIRLKSYNDFEEDIRRAQEGETSGSDAIEDNADLDPTFFYLNWISNNDELEGGSNKMETPESNLYFTKNYKTNNDNCLIGCIKLHTQNKKQINTLRKELNIPEGKISLAQIPLIEKHFNLKINVMGDSSFDDYLYQSSTNPDVRVLLKDEHYSLIIKNKATQIKKYNKQKKEELIPLYFYFDLETVFNRNKCNFLEAYSASWFITPTNDKFEYSEKKLEKCQFEYGSDCVKKLLKAMRECPKGYRYILIGFNSSKFDNYFLANEACLQDELTDIFYVNNCILGMKIGNHSVFDVRRFLSPDASLKSACISFATNPKKLDGFSHEEPQQAFEEGKLDEWIQKNLTKLIEYNKKDVLSMVSLTTKLNNAVMEMTGKNIFSAMTIASFAYSHFEQTIKDKYEIPKLPTYEDDQFCRKSLTAGRTQAYFGKFQSNKPFKMVDAKSLYPFVMTTNKFPIGEITFTENYIKNKLGIYSCIIHHQKAKWLSGQPKPKGFEEYYRKYAPVIFPKRSEEPNIPLDWEYRGEMNVNLCSIDIEEIKYYCGEDAITVNNGFYWEKSTKNLFNNFMLPFKEEKTRQDKLKNEGNKDYNPALREFTKLMQNSLSGKVIQRNFTSISKRVRKASDILKFKEKLSSDSCIETCQLGDNITFIKGDISEEDAYKDSAKPSYLGIFIYAYARRYMYQTVLNKYLTFYQDTDSALIPEEEFNRFKKEQPELFGTGEYGSFEEEIGKSKNIIIISPKNYLVVSENDEKSKRKFKGIKKSDTFLLKEDMPKEDEIIKLKEDILKDKKYKIDNIDEILIKKGKPCMTEEMFKNMYDGKELFIFTSQLKRTMKFNKEEIKSEIGIQQIFMHKHFNGIELEN